MSASLFLILQTFTRDAMSLATCLVSNIVRYSIALTTLQTILRSSVRGHNILILVVSLVDCRSLCTYILAEIVSNVSWCFLPADNCCIVLYTRNWESALEHNPGTEGSVSPVSPDIRQLQQSPLYHRTSSISPIHWSLWVISTRISYYSVHFTCNLWEIFCSIQFARRITELLCAIIYFTIGRKLIYQSNRRACLSSGTSPSLCSTLLRL